MKGKQLLSISIVTMLVITMIPILSASASPSPYISVVPSSITYDAPDYCTYLNDEFTVRINVTGPVTKVYGYEFWLAYNDTLLQTVGGVVCDGSGQVAPSDPGFRSIDEPSVSGEVRYSLSFWPKPGPIYPPSWNSSAPDHTGVLAWVTFKVIYCPAQLVGANNTVSCDLELTRAKLFDTDGTSITTDPAVDGYYEYMTRGLVPGAPTAEFTWSPTFPKECDTVTLDAGPSDPGPSPANITSYKWTIVSGPATLTGSATTEVTTMHCDGPGTVTVMLNITNDFGYYDTVSHDIEQREVAGCELDLYTDEKRFCGQTTPNVGLGLGENCDALSPDINVTLFAKVTWNGKPVMHVLVAFQVIYEWKEVDQELGFPDGYVLLNATQFVRTAETDKDGIAKTWFRIPNPCDGPVFGKWLVIATGKVQENKQTDSMRFDVGYVIHLIEVFTLKEIDEMWVPYDEFAAPCEYVGIEIKLKNIMWIDKEVTLVIVIYDDCDVPIGKIITGQVIEGGVYCSPHKETIKIIPGIHLPQWTYVGTGKVYVSAYTTLPSLCGVPYCPEVSAEFLLEWSGL